MNYLICVLFATLYVAVSAENIMDKEGYYFDNRPRTGHFREWPYMDLYKNYVQVFIAPQFKGTRVHETDSYKNYAASAEHCLNVFESFQNNDYEVEKLEKLVELDSCLGYLYDDEYINRYHDEDRKRPIVAEKLDGYINDTKLKALYDGTQVDKIADEAQVCIGDLLLQTIQIKHQYPNLACNNHHIELLNRFGDCHKTIPEELRETDSYLSVLYKLVKTKGEECFKHELLATNDAIRGDYKNNVWRHLKGWNAQGKQMKERMWPKEMIELLSAVQGAKKNADLINLREILAFARATYEQQPRTARYVRTLLDNLKKYANSNINLKKVSKNLGLQDEDGRVRYTRMVDGLCRYFRSTDAEDEYDYATAFARLVHMLDFPDLFDINVKQFLDMILNGYETAPTYTSIVICNIITYTQGIIKRDADNRVPSYEVSFKKDTSGMVRWPDAGFY